MLPIPALTRKQAHRLMLHKGKNKTAYLASIMGVKPASRPIIDWDGYNPTSDRVFIPADIHALRSKVRQKYLTKGLKTPTTKDTDWFGVEIECFIPKDAVSDYLGNGNCDGSCRENCTCYDCPDCGQHDDSRDCECECNCVSDNHIDALAEYLKDKKVIGVEVVSDGSLEDTRKTFGVEIKVLSRRGDMRNLERVCEILAELGAEIDTSCGLHVHLDARHMSQGDLDRANRNFLACLPQLIAMVPHSRRVNRYCKYGSSSTERYHMVNLSAFAKHRTIEIRLHSGTTAFRKISNWARIIGHVMSFGTMPMDDDLAAYVVERASKFSNIDAEDSSEVA